MLTIESTVSTSSGNDQSKSKRSSKSRWERLCVCERSVSSLCMCCDNVTKNKKHQVKIYIK